ncbi:MAG TPA: DUF2079 domain-containing protein [Acidimicrobiia bacterium]|nr:DUF2079 domain-containing protein [Acidimicrobiia bacterium]
MTAFSTARVARRVRAAHPSWFVLVAMAVFWAVLFGVLVWRRHDRFGSFGFDMGIFDQAVWLAARGKSFITVRGLDLFGHHANVAFYFLAPFSWMGAGPHFLNLLQVAGLAACALPLYLLGRHRNLSPWVALVPAAAFLAHPSTGFLAWELFHPETVAVPFLLGAYLAAAKQEWRWFAVLLVVAVMWKEDVALAAFFLGLLLLARGERKVALWTMVLSLAWFLFVNRFLLGAVNGAGAFYDEFFGDLGGSPFDIAHTAASDPTRIVRKFGTDDARGYLWQMVSPFGMLPLLSPLVVLIGFPTALGNILSVNSFTRDITFHYSALPLAALALGAVETLAWFRNRLARPWVTSTLAGVMLVTALMGAKDWGVSPWGDEYRLRGWWPGTGDPAIDTKRFAVTLIPDGDAVSATYSFVPHLSHRDLIYEFPNPYGERNWGIRGEKRHDPSKVRWLIADYRIMGAEDRAVFDSAIDDYEFEIVLERDGIVVARRTG